MTDPELNVAAVAAGTGRAAVRFHQSGVVLD
jgi:hypothetical protein